MLASLTFFLSSGRVEIKNVCLLNVFLSPEQMKKKILYISYKIKNFFLLARNLSSLQKIREKWRKEKLLPLFNIKCLLFISMPFAYLLFISSLFFFATFWYQNIFFQWSWFVYICSNAAVCFCQRQESCHRTLFLN